MFCKMEKGLKLLSEECKSLKQEIPWWKRLPQRQYLPCVQVLPFVSVAQVERGVLSGHSCAFTVCGSDSWNSQYFFSFKSNVRVMSNVLLI